MESNNHYKPKRPILNVVIRVFICMVILLIGVMGMTKLAGLKKPPTEVAVEERPIRVEAMVVQREDVPVFITGYGEAGTITEVMIAPEVTGQIVMINPRLHEGEIISRGETLFEIDTRNYQASFDEARASVQQYQSTIERLKKQNAIDTTRLKTLLRNKDLAGAEFDRLRKLYNNDKVGTRSGVENAEQAYNNTTDLADQMKRAIELYPIQIKEAESGLASARARLSLAQANLERCRVRSPFNGRVKSVSLEKGQFVSPGQQALILADDSVLEIQVPLDSRDARKWLQFAKDSKNKGAAWFSSLKQVSCEVYWTEDKEGHTWAGKLHRVVKFDQKTRTLTVAVRISSDDVFSNNNGQLPLVEGMFCSVKIPGKTIGGVFCLPRQSVSFEKTVHVIIDNRLKTIPVEVVRLDGENAYVSKGLKGGDTVVITRLIDPLEDSLVEITNTTEGEQQS